MAMAKGAYKVEYVKKSKKISCPRRKQQQEGVTLLVLWYLFNRYLCVPPVTTQKSTARKCNILLSIEIHVLEI